MYDLTIAYARDLTFLEAPSIWQAWSEPHLSNRRKFHIHAEKHPISTLPSSDEELAKWLEDRWIEKGARLEKMKNDLEHGVDWDGSSKKTL